MQQLLGINAPQAEKDANVVGVLLFCCFAAGM